MRGRRVCVALCLQTTKRWQTQNSYVFYHFCINEIVCEGSHSKTSAVVQMCIYNIVLFISDAAVFSSTKKYKESRVKTWTQTQQKPFAVWDLCENITWINAIVCILYTRDKVERNLPPSYVFQYACGLNENPWKTKYILLAICTVPSYSFHFMWIRLRKCSVFFEYIRTSLARM